MPVKLKVLIVDDSEDDALFTIRELGRGGFDPDWRRVDTAESMAAALAGDQWDLIISDHQMPHFDSLGALATLNKTGRDIPFIIVSGMIGEDTAVSAMKSGAADYLRKDNLKRLVPAVERELEEADVRRRKRIAEDRLLKSEARYRMLFERMMDSFALLERIDGAGGGADFLYLDLNESYSTALGLKREDVIGRTIREMVPGVGGDLLEHYDAVARAGVPEHFEHYSATARRYFEIDAYSPRPDHVATIIRDITIRRINAERQDVMSYILETINRENDTKSIILDIINIIKHHFGFDALGLRLRQGSDFPYYLYDGFSSGFLETENSLCSRNETGEPVIDSSGGVVLECLCGLVLTGSTGGYSPYFTEGGSFWCNDLALLPDSDPDMHYRGRCVKEGYNTMALIPIRSGEETIGLLQLNSLQKNMFDAGLIRFFESIGLTVGIALKRRRIEDEIKESEEKYRQLFNVESDAIFLIDNDTGELLEMNESASVLYGYSREELLRMKNTDLSAEPDRTRKAMEDRATAIPIRYHRKKDGTVFPVEITASHLTWKGRQVHIAAIRDITQRMRADADLRESEEKYRTLVEENPFLICTIKPDGVTLFVNRYVEDITGYAAEVVTGANWWDIFYPGELRAQVDELLRTFESGDVRGFEMRLLRRDGETRILQWNSFNRWDDGGRLVEINGVGIDVTERKLAEEALMQSEEKYRTLFETMAQGVVYQDAQGAIISANPAAERILGLTLEQMAGRTSIDPRWNAIHEDGSEYPGDAHPSMIAFQTGKEVRGEIMGVYNPELDNYRWISINAIPQFRPGEDRPHQVYTTFTDITDLKLAEQQARFRFQFLYVVINAINVPVFFKDAQGVYVGCNQAFEEYLGKPLTEIVGKTVFDLAPRELAEKYQAMDNELLSKGGEQVYEARVQYADGSLHDVMFNKSVYYDTRGAVGGIVGVMLDITERKKAEEAVRESERFALSTVNSIDANIAILDGEGEILSVNRSWREFALNNSVDPVSVFEGANYLAVCDAAAAGGDENAARFAAGIRAVISGSAESHVQEYPCHSPKERRWFVGTVTRFTGDGPVRIVVAHVNITERVLAEEKITASLREKEVLLKEIHHRVKNNMQVISSLMGLQWPYIERGGDIKAIFNDMESRIKSMAIVHDKLYNSPDFSNIDFKEYISSLLATIGDSYMGVSDRISINVNVKRLLIGIDVAIPCGLILNELITNAVKYAFPGGRGGVITITMEEIDGQRYLMSVKDDGVGLPDGFNVETSGSLGMRLVRILTNQIEGSLEVSSGNGSLFAITFPRCAEASK